MFGREKIYNVYLKPKAKNPLETSIFIEEGFSFMAFIFNAFWALYYRVWSLFIFSIVVMILFELLGIKLGLSNEAVNILNIGLYAWIGFEANNWRGASLEKRGYILYDVVSATNSLGAKQRFFDSALKEPQTA